MLQCNFGQITDECNFEELAFYINFVSIIIMTVASTADPNNVGIKQLPSSTLIAFLTVSQDKEKWDKKSDNFDSIPNTIRKIGNPIFLDIQQGLQKYLQNLVKVVGSFSTTLLVLAGHILSCLGVEIDVWDVTQVSPSLRLVP